MGIYDREYYRRDRSSVFSALSGGGSVCNALIVITVVAFVVQMMTRESSLFGGMIPNSGWFTAALEYRRHEILGGQVWRLITYAFLHTTSDIWHIVFNMLLLWMVGREIEGIYGSREFLAFYLFGALVGGLGQLAADTLRLTNGGPMIGASGAVTAVLVLFALHFPTRVFYLFFVIPIPAIVLVVIYVVVDALGLLSGRKDQVAVACHLGGALFGYLYYRFQWRILNWWPSAGTFRSWTRRQPRLRVFRGETEEEPVPVHAGSRPTPDSELEAELDAVLEKVSRYGQSSLNEREQRILLRASEIYRNRRK